MAGGLLWFSHPNLISCSQRLLETLPLLLSSRSRLYWSSSRCFAERLRIRTACWPRQTLTVSREKFEINVPRSLVEDASHDEFFGAVIEFQPNRPPAGTVQEPTQHYAGSPPECRERHKPEVESSDGAARIPQTETLSHPLRSSRYRAWLQAQARYVAGTWNHCGRGQHHGGSHSKLLANECAVLSVAQRILRCAVGTISGRKLEEVNGNGYFASQMWHEQDMYLLYIRLFFSRVSDRSAQVSATNNLQS
ncbi:hypothetical protein CORC01_09666 [Colletotrichum orchidophilum]|uniref:Uncharacterized protein n=1 Tax=Colletotrichum orchidophilum TaxID=1209926 RepID=A0A1G4B0R1_9PEZI|nr:uncharacterized protein CORC01_09666 [Colletotrichum orchidophilum]OHE95009.1 hypothetical protein CORC01_09666 [Colletotrichum orchidophilum]